MFDSDDPRSALVASAGPGAPSARVAGPAEYAVLSDTAPAHEDGGANSWYVRAQNFIINHAELPTGATLARSNQLDEYVVLLPDRDTTLSVTTIDGTQQVAGHSLLILPPGDSSVTAVSGGRLTRLFTVRAQELLTRCLNAASYQAPKPNISAYAPWPAPPDGYHLRVYPLDVADEPGRFGRIWRYTTFMVNYLPAQSGPRDPTKLSPHQHDDFEQASVGLDGDFVHHLRWPWTSDRCQWRADEHTLCPSPSVTVIPPPALHTTEAVGTGINQLVDIFCPPRQDFSQQPGWVLNAGEYPAASDAYADTTLRSHG